MRIWSVAMVCLLVIPAAVSAQYDTEHLVVVNATADNSISSTFWGIIPDNLSQTKKIFAFTGTRLKFQCGWLDLCVGGSYHSERLVAGFHSRHLLIFGSGSQFGILSLDKDKIYLSTNTGVKISDIGTVGLETENVKMWQVDGLGLSAGPFFSIKFGQHFLGGVSYRWRINVDKVPFWRSDRVARLTTAFYF